MKIHLWVFRAVLFSAIAVVLGVFSQYPSYQAFPQDKAQVIVSFSLYGARAQPCRELTEKEMADLPANMRRPTICPRPRTPVLIEMKIDGEVALFEWLAPTGFAKDGPAQIFEKFQIPVGSHELTVAIRNTNRPEGYDMIERRTFNLGAREILVVDFREDKGIWFRTGSEDGQADGGRVGDS